MEKLHDYCSMFSSPHIVASTARKCNKISTRQSLVILFNVDMKLACKVTEGKK